MKKMPIETPIEKIEEKIQEFFNRKNNNDDSYKLLIEKVVRDNPDSTVGEMLKYAGKEAPNAKNDNTPLAGQNVRVINFALDVDAVRHELVQIMKFKLEARGVPAEEAADKAAGFIDNTKFSVIAPLIKQYHDNQGAFNEGRRKNYQALPREVGEINNFIDSESNIVKKLAKEVTEGYGEERPVQKREKHVTIDEFLKEQGIRGYSFDKITGHELNRVIKDNFSLTSNEERSAIRLASHIRAVAEKEGVRLEDLKDIKEVMGFDKNPRNLSDKELAAYLVAKAASNISDVGGREIRLRPDTSFTKPLWSLDKESMESALAIGRKIFADTYPSVSSTGTSNADSMPVNILRKLHLR
jgi:hypothetical protein